MDSLKLAVMLMVEDDPGDQKLIKNALLTQGVSIDLHIASSGEEGLSYLRQSKKNPARYPAPNLILLDLNMPGMGGKEFLKCVKNCDELCDIPVVVLTTSDSELDIQQCYKLHAAGYVQKPVEPAKLKVIMKRIIRYWFGSLPLVTA